jgi:phosphopantothenoylcysteine decarboxylase/phosphopantothenate--cysteine ligase
VRRIDVRSAQEMHDAVTGTASGHDIVIAAAAVADYRPRTRARHKVKRGGQAVTLELEPTPDVLAAVTALRPRPFTVGFAAETEDLERNAQHKRMSKSLDMIAANWVGRPGSGFDGDDNELTVYWEGGWRLLSQDTKSRVARGLIDVIAERYHAKGAAQDS